MRSLHRGLLFGRGLTSGLPSASAGLAARAKLKAMASRLEPTMAAEPTFRVLGDIARTLSVFAERSLAAPDPFAAARSRRRFQNAIEQGRTQS